MKTILYIYIFLFSLVSCDNSKQKESITEKPNDVAQKIVGNLQTVKRFEELRKILIVEEDSLRNIDFFNQHFTEVNCKSKFLADNDYDNETDSIFIREYSIVISDSIEIKALQKQSKILEYIYTYKDKPFIFY